jgi:hypothetical protein
MRFRTSMFLITLFVACFTIAAWSTPLTAQRATDPSQPTPDTN